MMQSTLRQCTLSKQYLTTCMKSLFNRGQVACFLLMFLFFGTTKTSAQSTLVDLEIEETTCDSTTGSVNLTPLQSGTYTYLWNTGATTANLANLNLGVYTCTVTNNGTTEVIRAAVTRKWELKRFVEGDTLLSIVDDAVTMNPNVPKPVNNVLDQRTHVYDNTPIDVKNQTGSIFCKFTNNHASFPNQVYDSTKPPVFYVELFEAHSATTMPLQFSWVGHSELYVGIGGILPVQIKINKGRQYNTPDNYVEDYNSDDEIEVRFLGNHQLEFYLNNTLIHSLTLPQKQFNDYIATIGFNDDNGLDRRVAYDLRSTFCSDMPIIAQSITHNDKYGQSGAIELTSKSPSYLTDTYTYNWSTGASTANIDGLEKGTYTVTITSSSSATKVLDIIIEDKMSLEPASTESIIKIVDNSFTIDPAFSKPVNNIVDYRTYAYDPSVPINVVNGGGSVKFWMSANHPNFVGPAFNGELYNAIVYINLQEAVQPLPPFTNFLDFPFKILLRLNGKMHAMNGYADEGYYQDSNRIGYTFYHEEGLEVELRFTGNRVVEIYINEQLLRTETLVENIDEYYIMWGSNDRDAFERRVIHDIRTDLPSRPPVIYATPKQILDGAFVKLLEPQLRFKFEQEYATDDDTPIAYTIYNWQRQAVHQANFDVNYGINWEILNTSIWGVTSQEYYTLEFTGNKGEQYYIRFQAP